ncbi:response regulator [Granulicoccus phenolivorans]|uniref:response regulator n=1 Tax=Granulicoccus phenolivorans TaxID=266854 RepID=UPI000426147C|nr:response regulator transcription factor [Granulicoccus phenolivorans]
MTISVLVVDDQMLVRRGFRLLLEIEPDLEIVGEAGDGIEAVARVKELRPDVVLMDVRMPRMDGVEATRRITALPHCTTRVIMLTTFDLDDYVHDALRAGASGFLLKDVDPSILVTGIRSVYAGDALLAPRITSRLITAYLAQRPSVDRAAREQVARLTGRERETLDLIVRGLSNAEIAATLFVAETTVKTHVARLLAKLGLRDRVHAVIYAYDHGLVRPPTDPGQPEAAGR